MKLLLLLTGNVLIFTGIDLFIVVWDKTEGDFELHLKVVSWV